MFIHKSEIAPESNRMLGGQYRVSILDKSPSVRNKSPSVRYTSPSVGSTSSKRACSLPSGLYTLYTRHLKRVDYLASPKSKNSLGVELM